jgi:hypothetical protein
VKCDACGGELRPSAVRFCGPLCESWFHEGGPEHARREVARMLGTLEMIDMVADEMIADGLIVETTQSESKSDG